MKNMLTLFLMLVTLAANAQRRGQSEFFLEINESGFFTVSVNDETIRSGRGRFRFYDMETGRNRVTVELNGRNVFRQDLDLAPGSRTIATYTRSGGLKVKSRLPLRRQDRYNLDDWDGELLFDPASGNHRPTRVDRGMGAQELAYLKRMVEKESFDNNRLKLLKISLRDNPVSVDQLNDLLALLSFDDARLEIAMHAYNRVPDPENYYRLLGSFRFPSSREKLERFLDQQFEERKGRPQGRPYSGG